MSEKTIWMVRAGRGGAYVDDFIESNFVGIGFCQRRRRFVAGKQRGSHFKNACRESSRQVPNGCIADTPILL